MLITKVANLALAGALLTVTLTDKKEADTFQPGCTVMLLDTDHSDAKQNVITAMLDYNPVKGYGTWTWVWDPNAIFAYSAEEDSIAWNSAECSLKNPLYFAD